MAVTAVTVTAACRRCAWTAGGDWTAVDRQAEKHTRQDGHATAVIAVPA